MNELVQTITEAIQEKKGSNIVIADLRKIEGTISQYFIICQGNSPSQVEAITESVGDFARDRLKEKPSHVVGLENAQWVAMDYGDVLVQKMHSGWRWTTVMCWCISSCPMCVSIMTWSTSGKMPH